MVESYEQQRLNLLFEMESIKAPLMGFIAPGVNLKIVTDLGQKDANGNKRKFYEENRYKSSKYKNVDTLVSSSFKVNSYLVLEYPNQNYDKELGNMKSNGIIIRGYALDDLSSMMKSFNSKLVKCFGIKDGNLYVLADKAKEVTFFPSFNTSISFSPDIYENIYQDNHRMEMGVRLTFNNEFSTIVSAETTWLEMIYRISHCDLTMLSFQMIQAYMALLPGMAVNDLSQGIYTDKYRPFNEDPEEIVKSGDSVNVKGFKPLPRKNGKSFFD